MDRSTFIRSLVGVVALQAIPASVLPIAQSQALPVISYAECLQPLPAIRLHDILITPDGEAYQVVEVYEHDVHARVIDDRQYRADMVFTHDQAQQMRCSDWDDLDTELYHASKL